MVFYCLRRRTAKGDLTPCVKLQAGMKAVGHLPRCPDCGFNMDQPSAVDARGLEFLDHLAPEQPDGAVPPSVTWTGVETIAEAHGYADAVRWVKAKGVGAAVDLGPLFPWKVQADLGALRFSKKP